MIKDLKKEAAQQADARSTASLQNLPFTPAASASIPISVQTIFGKDKHGQQNLTEDEDQVPILLSPALQHALVESPREQQLYRQARSRSNSIAFDSHLRSLDTSLTDAKSMAELPIDAATVAASTVADVTHSCANQKLVKFGNAIILNDSPNDYFGQTQKATA